ncbi:S-DNA-T family DNA segregation ATPase FtsK/SpoIIIE [Bradyrhizobium sp. GM7.3]
MSMSTIERVIPLVSHLPPSIREGLARRVRELSGLGLIALSGAASAALMTWSVQDPSLSHATSRPIRNILGYAGAIGADLAMQILGLGAIMLVLTVAVWGWRMLTHRPFDREALRLGCWILCTVIAAGFVSCWPHGGAWPLPIGLGGVVGDALVRAPAVIFGPPGMIYRIVLGTILFAAMAATFLIACGLGAREHDDELAEIEDDDKPLDLDEESDRGSVSLGWLFHALMSTKARLIWLLGAAYRSLVSSGPKTKAVAFSRQEPKLGGGRAAPPISPQSEDEHDEDEHEEDHEEEEEEEPAARAPRKKAAPKAASKKSSDKFELPSVSVLAAPKAGDRQPLSKAELETNSRALEGVLQDFGVRGEIVKAHPGPVVTLYELEPAPGIKSSRVIGLSDDIARSMSALSARVAVVPGRNAIGIELPNAHREKVYLRELLVAKETVDSVAKLPLCLGKTIGGDPVIIDLARTPHMLIAGTTGSGKSVAINTMILSLVYRLRPDQCRLIMVDPKMLELSVYDGIPHLLTPVVTDPKKAVVALKWAVREMEERYKNMAKLGVRNIDGYNTRLLELKAKGEEPTRTVHNRLRQGNRQGDLRGREALARPAALHRHHRRRNGRPDDGCRQGHRRRGAAPRADGARRRPARDPRNAASIGRRHHRYHQGELPNPHRLPGDVQDRQPHDSRRDGCRAAARPGRHALHGRGRSHQPRARTFRVGRGSREGGAPPQDAGTAGISRSRHGRRTQRRRGRRGVRRVRHGRGWRRRFVLAGCCDRQTRP